MPILQFILYVHFINLKTQLAQTRIQFSTKITNYKFISKISPHMQEKYIFDLIYNVAIRYIFHPVVNDTTFIHIGTSL